MKSQKYAPGRGPIGYAFLSRREQLLFRRLIDDRRSLPVHRVGGWVCYECPFGCADLATMARHILRVHAAAPVSEKDEDDDDRADPTGQTDGRTPYAE